MKINTFFFLSLLANILFHAPAYAGGSPSMPASTSIDPTVYFIEPSDGATVPQAFKVKFGLSGMGVAPAGIDVENTGHHHLLIDTEVLPNLTQSLPATDKIKHFGKGQTETELQLAPGKHTLQLLLGNYIHVPHKKPVISKQITVIVK